MRETGADMHTMTLEKGLATFLNALSGKNRSAATIRAYQTDIAQFISFLHANNVSIQKPAEVEKIDVMEYLSSLAKRELTGIARARKMSALREYFRFLEGVGVIAKSPTTGIETPKREKKGYVRDARNFPLLGQWPAKFTFLDSLCIFFESLKNK